MKNKKADNPGPSVFFWIAVMVITIFLILILFGYAEGGLAKQTAKIKNIFGFG